MRISWKGLAFALALLLVISTVLALLCCRPKPLPDPPPGLHASGRSFPTSVQADIIMAY